MNTCGNVTKLESNFIELQTPAISAQLHALLLQHISMLKYCHSAALIPAWFTLLMLVIGDDMEYMQQQEDDMIKIMQFLKSLTPLYRSRFNNDEIMKVLRVQ